MVARVSTFKGTPEQLEEGVRIFTENVLPWLRDATGFRGWIALIDRPNDRAITCVGSHWPPVFSLRC